MDMRGKERTSIGPVFNKRQEFAKIGRKLRVMQREGKEPPLVLVDRYIKLDDWLTHNTTYWRSHFEFKRNEEI